MGTVVGQADPANQNNLLVVETEQRSCEDSSIRPNSSEGSNLDGYGERAWGPTEIFQSQRAGTWMRVRWLCQSTGGLSEHVLTGTIRLSQALSCSCSVTEDAGSG